MRRHLVAAGGDGHGKTSLIAALGLLHDDRVGVHDHCGHERLIREVLGPAQPGVDAYLPRVDAYLLIVAADAGITEQTREHAALLRALGVESGLTIVTKADLADPADAIRAAAELVPGTPAHATSILTDEGLDAVRAAVSELLATLRTRANPPPAALTVDRPRRETRVIDAALDFGPRREREPEHGVRVMVHLGGRESPARLARLGGRFWQIRLEQLLAAAAGDRFVIRRLDLSETLGGGVVLDPGARRHPTSNEVIVRLTRISRGHAPLPPDPPRGS